MTAIEMTGTVDENCQLRLDGKPPFAGPKRVRVIVLSPLTEESDELSELLCLCRFHSTTFQAQKCAQSVCMTEPIGQHKHVILAFITSRVSENPLPTDLVLPETDKDFPQTGLRVSSCLQLHRMMTVTTSLIVREFGELPSHVQFEVDRKLNLLFGIQ